MKHHQVIGVVREDSGNIAYFDLSSVEEKLSAMTIDEINRHSKSKGRSWTLIDLIIRDVELNG